MIKEYGKGYSFPQLVRMSQFARFFTFDEIVSQFVIKIPWAQLWKKIYTK